MSYYGIRIAILCVTEGAMPSEGYTQDIQVHLVDAVDDADAFKKALEIGRKEEHSYKNNDGDEVRWLFKGVEAITCLGGDVEGKEVSSRMEIFYPDSPLDLKFELNPEASNPIVTSNESTP